jgi:hypothetical protein
MNSNEYVEEIRKYKEKKVGVEGLQPTLFLHNYRKLLN